MSVDAIGSDKGSGLIKVLLVDDHTIFRDGLKRLLHEETDIQVHAEASDAAEAIAHLRSSEFSLVLLDINMPGRSGLDILPTIRAEWPTLPVIVLSMYPTEQYVLRALDLGASGYVTKDMDSTDLLDSIRKVAKGGKYFPMDALAKILSHISADNPAAPHHALSPREFEIMLLIVRGMRLVDIGKKLFLSVKTISTYRSRILSKLQVSSNAELAQYALRHQIID